MKHGHHRGSSLEGLVAERRLSLKNLRPEIMEYRTGLLYSREKNTFDFQILNRRYKLSYPDLIVLDENRKEAAEFWQALVLHYLATADAAPLSHEWVSLRDLPDTMLYEKAFQGYSGLKLAKALGNNEDDFRRAAESLGAISVDKGDAAYVFWALPRVPLLVIYWLGDEEFPPSAQFLFDANAAHYLPSDALAVVSGWLCGMIIRAAGIKEANTL